MGGRPRQQPPTVDPDRGDDHDKDRQLLRQRGIIPGITRPGTAHGSGLGRLGWVLEPTVAWLQAGNRRPIGSERRPDIQQAMGGLVGSIHLRTQAAPAPRTGLTAGVDG